MKTWLMSKKNSPTHSINPLLRKIAKICNKKFSSQRKIEILTLSKEAFRQLCRVNLFKIVLIEATWIKRIKLLKMNISNCLNFKRLKFRGKLSLLIITKFQIVTRYRKMQILNFRNMRSMFRWLRKRIRSL